MDPARLIDPAFWDDPTPVAAGEFPGTLPEFEELCGHVLFETSGSSGTPKWIALSKSALAASAASVNQHLGVSPESRWGLALPTRHVGGFGVCARSFAAGCALESYSRPWNAASFAAWAEASGITHLSLVPTQVHDLVSGGHRAPSTLSAVVVGGGRLEPTTGQAARDLGWPVLASFGMTEASSQIATQLPEEVAGAYRTAPISLLPIWQAGLTPEGRLRIAGPALFTGQLLRPGAAWVFQRRESDWHETQDRAELADRAITPLGRGDTLVKILGELVDPEAIEQELAELSKGRLIPGSYAVVALPDSRTEHSLVLVFERNVSPDVLRQAVNAYHSRAPGFRRLGREVLLDFLPRSPLGKLRRSTIRELLDG